MNAKRSAAILTIVSRGLVVAVLMAVLDGCGGERQDASRAGRSSDEPRGYVFTADWFGSNIPRWETLLAEFKGRPHIRYLEVGVYEGRSLFWMLDNIMTHPTSRLVAVDIFFDDYEQKFLDNLDASGAADRITVVKERGEYALKTLADESFDVIYLDGGHAANTVFAQAALAWQLLREGGLLILDDYRWSRNWPIDLRPELPINTFITAYSQELDVLQVGRDVVVRKVPRLCKQYYCSSFFDRYVYAWEERKLLTLDGSQEIELSDQERKLVESFLSSLRPGRVTPELTPAVRSDPVFERLSQRLQLDD